jgi:hypothetical protein
MFSQIKSFFKKTEQNDSVDALLIPTSETFIDDKWEKTLGISSPVFTLTERVYHNQKFTLLMLLKSYGVKNGKAKVRYKYEIMSENV